MQFCEMRLYLTIKTTQPHPSQCVMATGHKKINNIGVVYYQ